MAVGEIGGVTVTLKAEADVNGVLVAGAKVSETAKKIQSDFKGIDAAVSTSNSNLNSGFNSITAASKKAASQFKFQKGGMA